MKQRVLIVLALIFLMILLVGLNAASYTQKEVLPDRELAPNRSTFHAGATGTRAFFDFLAETGRQPVRWQEPMSALLTKNNNSPTTFVVIGKTRREFTDKEIQQLLQWVSQGGKLVVIDRQPVAELVKTTANWGIEIDYSKDVPLLDSDPANQPQMIDKAVAAKPVQPTFFIEKVNAVQPSRFASSIKFERFSDAASNTGSADKNDTTSSSTEKEQEALPKNTEQTDNDLFKNPPPAPPPPPVRTAPQESGDKEKDLTDDSSETLKTSALTAPVIHLSNSEKNLLADFPFGSGEIVVLTDPYIVSNGGINLVDNARLAVNIVASRGGVIAFDEFHQGYGESSNSLLAYFEGTPLTAITLQIIALLGVVLYTQSRRFARPLPENKSDRLSKLEYVSAMAELQQRTKAFDLAIENIYTDFRRRSARLFGVDNFTITLSELAKMISERAKINTGEVEDLMFKCEEIIRGEPTDKREVVQLTSRLRNIEEQLGLDRRRGR